MSDTDLCRWGCGARGTHYCPGQDHGVQPGLPLKIKQLEAELASEKDMRHMHERTINLMEGFRASWEARCKSAETTVKDLRRSLEETEAHLENVKLELEAAESEVSRLSAEVIDEVLAETNQQK